MNNRKLGLFSEDSCESFKEQAILCEKEDVHLGVHSSPILFRLRYGRLNSGCTGRPNVNRLHWRARMQVVPRVGGGQPDVIPPSEPKASSDYARSLSVFKYTHRLNAPSRRITQAVNTTYRTP